MFAPLEITQMAHAKAAHAAVRQSVIARNVANADTPGYRASDVEDFASFFQRHQAAERRLGHGIGQLRTLPEIRPMETGAWLSPNGNSVSLEEEMMRAIEVRHQHDMALGIYRTASSILRASLGR